MVDLNDSIYEFLRDDRVFLEELYEDQQVDPRLPWSLAGARERDQLAGALRQLADVLTSRHDLPLPKDGYARLDVIAGDGRRVAEITHGSGGCLFRVLPGAFEQATDPRNASRLAAADFPATPATRLPDASSTAGNKPLGVRPADQAVRAGSRR
jgi:hypothetical protein